MPLIVANASAPPRQRFSGVQLGINRRRAFRSVIPVGLVYYDKRPSCRTIIIIRCCHQRKMNSLHCEARFEFRLLPRVHAPYCRAARLASLATGREITGSSRPSARYLRGRPGCRDVRGSGGPGNLDWFLACRCFNQFSRRVSAIPGYARVCPGYGICFFISSPKFPWHLP